MWIVFTPGLTLHRSSHIVCTWRDFTFTSGRLHSGSGYPCTESLTDAHGTQCFTLAGRQGNLSGLRLFPHTRKQFQNWLEMHSMTAVRRSLHTTPTQSDVPVHIDSVMTLHWTGFSDSGTRPNWSILSTVNRLLISPIMTWKSKQALVQQSLSQIASSYSIQSQLYFRSIIQSNLSCIESFYSVPQLDALATLSLEGIHRLTDQTHCSLYLLREATPSLPQIEACLRNRANVLSQHVPRFSNTQTNDPQDMGTFH